MGAMARAARDWRQAGSCPKSRLVMCQAWPASLSRGVTVSSRRMQGVSRSENGLAVQRPCY